MAEYSNYLNYAEIVDMVDQAIKDFLSNGSVKIHEIGDRRVEKANYNELLELRRYYAGLRARASGKETVKVRFKDAR